jgi:hypothetical protein
MIDVQATCVHFAVVHTPADFGGLFWMSQA